MQSPSFPRYLVPPRSKYSPQHHAYISTYVTSFNEYAWKQFGIAIFSDYTICEQMNVQWLHHFSLTVVLSAYLLLIYFRMKIVVFGVHTESIWRMKY